jgi:hypothetical protein
VKTFTSKRLLVLAFIASLILIGTLNCLGFCFDKMRVLSDDEKIKLAINKVLIEYPTKVFSEKFYRTLPKGDQESDLHLYGNGSSGGVPKHPIAYLSLEEFISLNPDCCQVTLNYHAKYKDDVGGDFTTFWSRVTGRKTSIVVVQYSMRYRDRDGKMQSRGMEFYSGMTNCGKFVCEYCF